MQKIELMKGWALEFVGFGNFEIVNRDEAGGRRFFSVVPGPYSPVMEEEPDGAEPLGVGTYRTRGGEHCSPEARVKGVICKESAGGKILYQGNLTNFRTKDGGVFQDGAHVVEVQGRRWRLYRLMAENQARLRGYVGFYCPEESHDGSPVEICQAFQLG